MELNLWRHFTSSALIFDSFLKAFPVYRCDYSYHFHSSFNTCSQSSHVTLRYGIFPLSFHLFYCAKLNNKSRGRSERQQQRRGKWKWKWKNHLYSYSVDNVFAGCRRIIRWGEKEGESHILGGVIIMIIDYH